MKEVNIQIIDKRREPFLRGALKTLQSVLVYGFLIYISQDSKWWTFFCGLMAVSWFLARFTIFYRESLNDVKTKEEYIDLADKYFK